MTGSLVAACLWVIAATITALLPMRRQVAPGLTLLLLAPPLLVWISWQHSVWIVLFGVFAVLSLFRRPLLYFARKAFGK